MMNSRESSKGMYRCKSNCRFVQDSDIGPIAQVNVDSLIRDDSPHKLRIPQYSRAWREGIQVANIAPLLHVSYASVFWRWQTLSSILLDPR